MPLLVYCVTPPDARPPEAPGVRGAAVESAEIGGVRAWYSEVERPADLVAGDALAVHHILSGFLARGSVLPFRFPTLVNDAPELATALAGRSEQLATELRRLTGLVQMEVRLMAPPMSSSAPTTGTAYLQARREAGAQLLSATTRLHAAVGHLITDWKCREARCYALVPRDNVERFWGVVREAKIAAPLQVRVSGPWPPLEFAAIAPEAGTAP